MGRLQSRSLALCAAVGLCLSCRGPSEVVNRPDPSMAPVQQVGPAQQKGPPTPPPPPALPGPERPGSSVEVQGPGKPGMVALRGGVLPAEGRSATPAPLRVVAALWMDITEVTVRAYAECVRARACNPVKKRREEECNADKADRGDHPMNCVTCSLDPPATGYVGKVTARDAVSTGRHRLTTGVPPAQLAHLERGRARRDSWIWWVTCGSGLTTSGTSEKATEELEFAGWMASLDSARRCALRFL
jgi:formylglycine-generating enzyme required for sulfatase activity